MADADSIAVADLVREKNHLHNTSPEHKAACVKYERTTKQGFLMRAYRNMRSRVLGIQWRKHHLYAGKDILERDDFYFWSLNSPAFNRLWDEWQAGGRQRREAPSVDRMDSDYGYELWNMRWVPFHVNCANIKTRKKVAAPPPKPVKHEQQCFEFA